MPSTYTSQEYADMLIAYGKANCSAARARAIYRERYPDRKLPSANTIIDTYRRLRQTGSVMWVSQEPRTSGVPYDVSVDEDILDAFAEDGTRSIREVAEMIGVSYDKVRNLLKNEMQDDIHDTPEQDMGRNSSRIASLRSASNSRKPTSYTGLLSDDEDDADWSGGSIQSDRRKCRMKNNHNKRSNKIHKSSRALRNSVLEPSTPESQTIGLTDEAGSPPDSSPSSSCSSSSRKRDRHRAAPKTKNKRDRNMSPNGRD